MINFVKNFVADEAGASAAEYALIIAVVGVGIGAAALVLGANVKQAIDGASDDIYNCVSAADPGAVTGASDGTECD
ncbi:Flp family type IVb pilin [Croceicoccus naphthovorans]|uniref:Uncharacterized protein n=1 Tax=Croceicoccus naphthovorans TaxID=1348774 RepID=A0A0G3XG13_9SPHN|nr:hypothetical protein [Croceicoccus naphthovorans]AKM09529.1 hypothetical protein AB433_05310 [Croceicoccus naphthovorans]MBB3989723.1 pilus assembly protein Flp/PilA [Croceicoccus naphthovorans]